MQLEIVSSQGITDIIDAIEIVDMRNELIICLKAKATYKRPNDQRLFTTLNVDDEV